MDTITNEQVLTRLVESEAGRKAARDLLREKETHRISLKAQIETLKRERGAMAREHADDVEATRQRLEQARAALTKADGEHRQALAKQAQIKTRFDGRIKALENKLRATAPQTIDEFLAWLADVEHETQQTQIVERSQPTDKISTHHDGLIKQYWTNAAALKTRLAACRVARAEAEALRDKVLDADDLQQRLDTLRDSLPEVTMQFSHEK